MYLASTKWLVLFAGAFAGAFANAQYTAEVLPTPNGTGRAEGAGGGQIVGTAFGPGGGPALWNAPGYAYTSMMPSAFNAAELLGVGGGTQAGYARVTGGIDHALVWSGSANNYVDLHVANYVVGTQAWATDGVSQVGVGSDGGTTLGHALLWQGTAQSVVDLHPQDYFHSHAYGVWGDVQIGNLADFTLPDGAAMWRGTAESMQLLPIPKGYQDGFARAVHGNEIVGSVGVDGRGHAVVWGTDGVGFTDLTPKGWGATAFDTNGLLQVGFGAFDGGTEARALAWQGTSATMIDLHQFVPSGYAESRAIGIDENGVISGYAELAGFGSVPIVWTPVPEPAGLVAISTGLLMLAVRRRRSR